MIASYHCRIVSLVFAAFIAATLGLGISQAALGAPQADTGPVSGGLARIEPSRARDLLKFALEEIWQLVQEIDVEAELLEALSNVETVFESGDLDRTLALLASTVAELSELQRVASSTRFARIVATLHDADTRLNGQSSVEPADSTGQDAAPSGVEGSAERPPGETADFALIWIVAVCAVVLSLAFLGFLRVAGAARLGKSAESDPMKPQVDSPPSAPELDGPSPATVASLATSEQPPATSAGVPSYSARQRSTKQAVQLDPFRRGEPCLDEPDVGLTQSLDETKARQDLQVSGSPSPSHPEASLADEVHLLRQAASLLSGKGGCLLSIVLIAAIGHFVGDCGMGDPPRNNPNFNHNYGPTQRDRDTRLCCSLCDGRFTSRGTCQMFMTSDARCFDWCARYLGY